MRARGFATIYLIGALAVGAALVGSYFFGRSDGEDIERSKWVNQHAEDLAVALADNIALQAEISRQEREHAAAIAAIDAKYQEGLQNANDQASDLSERLRQYHRLRVERPAAGPAVGAKVPATAPAARECDGPPATRLAQEHGEFLVRYAARAQAIAEQLIACQAVVKADRNG